MFHYSFTGETKKYFIFPLGNNKTLNKIMRFGSPFTFMVNTKSKHNWKTMSATFNTLFCSILMLCCNLKHLNKKLQYLN